MHHQEQMKECIEACHNCHDVCKTTFFEHCLKQGGRHVEPSHIGVMADCMEICHVAANFMLRGSERHGLICGTCAVICDACAESCETFDTRDMKACAETCRACAKACREMSGDTYIPGQSQSGAHHIDHVM